MMNPFGLINITTVPSMALYRFLQRCILDTAGATVQILVPCEGMLLIKHYFDSVFVWKCFHNSLSDSDLFPFFIFKANAFSL